jgi:RNA polymerase-associated protein CTR9
MKLITVGVGETPAAIHILDTMLNGPESQRVMEATIMLASLRASERPALSAQEYAVDKTKARELFERVKRNAASHSNVTSKQHNGNTLEKPKKAAWLNDMEMHLEIARLWETEDVGKAMNAYQEARIISEKTSDGVDPRIVNNIAVLSHLKKDLSEARTLYEEALSVVSTVWAAHPSMDAMSTTILYNLARIYEDQGEISMAKEAFDKLLSQHPEYIDGMCP